jgi:hypothetical protein
VFILKKIKLLTLGVLCLSIISPLSSAAAEVANVESRQTETAKTIKNANTESTLDIEYVYLDEQGVEHPYNPHMRFTTSAVWIGAKFRYTSAADGRLLKNAFNSTYGVGAVGTAIGLLGLAGGPAAVVGAFVSLGLNGLRSRCREGASLVDAHPNGGSITMFLDRCTWSAS